MCKYIDKEKTILMLKMMYIRLRSPGSVARIRAKVRDLKEIFPTGLIVSPSHEAVFPDVEPQKIEALFATLTGKKIINS